MNLILNFKTGKTTTLNNVESIFIRNNTGKSCINIEELLSYKDDCLIFNSSDKKTILVFENSLESVEVQN